MPPRKKTLKKRSLKKRSFARRKSRSSRSGTLAKLKLYKKGTISTKKVGDRFKIRSPKRKGGFAPVVIVMRNGKKRLQITG